MASNFVGGVFQATDSNGIVPGALLFTYAAGTLNQLPTFTTQAGGTANQNPVVCDSKGQANVWLTTGAFYRMILRSPTGTTIYDVDNVEQSTGTAITQSLSSNAGSTFVNFLQAGTGAVVRTVQDKLRDTISVLDCGALGNGSADDAPAFAAAFSVLGAGGGTVLVPGGSRRYLIDTNLIVPSNVTLRGPMAQAGSPQDNSSANYGGVSALLVNSTVTITLRGGAGMQGLLLIRKGMTFPATSTTLYGGTAVTAGGDDVFVYNCMALGFGFAFYSTGYQRARIDNLNFDCTNGVAIYNCLDIPRIEGCHGWPFATTASGLGGASAHRSGTGFLFSNIGDWNKVTNCFTYGYNKGFYVSSADSMTFLGCGADGTGAYTGSIGFLADGSSNDTRFAFCQAAAQSYGYVAGTNAGKHTQIANCAGWGNVVSGILVNSGDVTIDGGIQRSVPLGIEVASTSGVVNVDNVRFDIISTAVLKMSATGANVLIGERNDYGSVAAGSSVVLNTSNRPTPSVASAATVLLPPTGSYFKITGTTGITGLNGGWANREITLLFQGTLTVTNSATLNLKGFTNRSATAGQTMKLMHDGTTWYEV